MNQRFPRKRIRKALALALSLLLAFACTATAAAAADAQNATAFVFSSGSVAVTQGAYSGYSVSGTDVSIQESGTYSFSGTCANGSITVKKGVTDVTLILNGINLGSAESAPLVCAKSSSVTIRASAGTENKLYDTVRNNDDVYPDNTDAENAVLKCKDGSNVTLCGTGTLRITASGKNGIKSGASTESEGDASLTIRDLTLEIATNVNDTIHAESALHILSGNLTIRAADDGIHSDYILNIGEKGGAASPVIRVEESNEGIEAATMHIYSGTLRVYAADDGINAANSDLTAYSFSCDIHGGSVYIDAGGDGIDSNGTLTLSGGTVEVYASAQNDNAPLDCDGAFTLSGGTVFAVGSGGMTQNPNSAAQPYVIFGSGGMGGQPGGMRSSAISIAAGDTVTIADAQGSILYSGTALRQAGYVFFSSSALTESGTYTLNINGACTATAIAGVNGSTAGSRPEGGQNPPDAPQPEETDDTCPYCGNTHTGSLGTIVLRVHTVFYAVRNLFSGSDALTAKIRVLLSALASRIGIRVF